MSIKLNSQLKLQMISYQDSQWKCLKNLCYLNILWPRVWVGPRNVIFEIAVGVYLQIIITKLYLPTITTAYCFRIGLSKTGNIFDTLHCTYYHKCNSQITKFEIKTVF